MGITKIEIEKQRQNRNGEENTNRYGELITIIEYRGSLDIDIQFEDGNIVLNKQYVNFQNGSIRNPYYKSVFGNGYMGEGKYKSKLSNNVHTDYYRHWKSMLERCYSEKCQKKYPTYIGCSVCDEWLNFQTFAQWYEINFYKIGEEQMCLDKDILHKGNKIYSPSTCVFVPQRINVLFVKCNANRGRYHIGVSYSKNRKSLISQCQTLDGVKYLGQYETVKESFQAYKIFKENIIKQTSEEYKSQIPQRLYDAMYDYVVEITD